MYPRCASYCGVTFLVGRVLYTCFYRTKKGARHPLREVGSVAATLSIFGNFVITVYSGLKIANLIWFNLHWFFYNFFFNIYPKLLLHQNIFLFIELIIFILNKEKLLFLYFKLLFTANIKLIKLKRSIFFF